MKRLKTLMAGTMTLALTLGGGLWAQHYVKAAAATDNAQKQEQSGKSADGKQGRGAERGLKNFGHGPGGFGVGFGFGVSDELAALLGSTKDELNEALKSGKTLAAIAGEKGVDVQAVIELIVAPQTERLDKELADGKLTQEQYDKAKTSITDNATKLVNGELKGPGGDLKLRGDFHFGVGIGFGVSDELAALLGSTKDELNEALKSAKTLAAIAGEKGVDIQAVIELIVAPQTERLDKQLADGKLTQEQYDQAKTSIADNAAKLVNGELKGPGGDRGGFHIGFRFAVSDELAALLGSTKDELNEALKSGKTLAAIAGEKGVDVQAVIDLLTGSQTAELDKQLADGKLTQEQYDKAKTSIADFATKFVNGEMGKGLPGGVLEGKFDHRGPGGAGMGAFGFRFAVSDELAALLGSTKDELNEALKSGKTLAAIAGEKGVDVQAVIDLLTGSQTAKLDEQLANGKLTQEQYDKAKTSITDFATKFVNGEMGGKGLPGFNKDGRGGKGASGQKGGFGQKGASGQKDSSGETAGFRSGGKAGFGASSKTVTS